MQYGKANYEEQSEDYAVINLKIFGLASLQPLERPGCLVELLLLPLARPQHGTGGGDHGRLILLHPGECLVAELPLGLCGDTL